MSFCSDIDYLWVAGRRKELTGDWVWPDGKNLTFIRWDTEHPDLQPNGGTTEETVENCLLLRTYNGLHHDAPCTTGASFLCSNSLEKPGEICSGIVWFAATHLLG